MNPGLKKVIPALVSYVGSRGGYVTKTKLLKLLYLFDVEYYRIHRKTFTDFGWKYFHLGPWTAEYDPLIDDLVGAGQLQRSTSSRSEYDTVFFKSGAAHDLDAHFSYKESFVLRTILDLWSGSTTGEILDHVYFRTEPMENAIRNEKLDFSTIPDHPPAQYKRSSSGKSSRDVQKLRAAFTKRVNQGGQEERFEFTPPQYDDEFAEAITKLDDLGR